MIKTFDSVKEMCDSDISMTFYLMVMAMNEKDAPTVSAWYRELLTSSDFAYRINLLTQDERKQLHAACDSVFKNLVKQR